MNAQRSIVFVGSSAEVAASRAWAERAGCTAVDGLVPEAEIAVVDEDVLDGLCTPGEGVLLAEVRAAGLRCLTPSQAQAHFAATGAAPPVAAADARSAGREPQVAS